MNSGDFFSDEEAFEHFVEKELLDGFDLRPGCNPEHVLRRSVEIVDRPYGVTMEKASVTRLVSVNLRKAELLAA